jgi:hypothetical protein
MSSTGSIACVGLDPRPEFIPPAIAAGAVRRHGDTPDAVAAAFVETNIAIIDTVAGRCAAVKPQAACYEAYGVAGWHALTETVATPTEPASRSSSTPSAATSKRLPRTTGRVSLAARPCCQVDPSARCPPTGSR